MHLFHVKSRYKQNTDALCTDRFPFHHHVLPCQTFQAEMLGHVKLH